MSHRFLNIILAVLCVSVLAISVLVNVWQADYVKKLNEEWNRKSLESVKVALDLAALERSFGYVGFIHHFKNYVLRRKETDFIDATAAYWEANNALLNLLVADLDDKDMKQILVVQDTLNEYFRNLNKAKLEFYNLPVLELDALVKVDDRSAREALISLRKNLLPSIEGQYFDTSFSNRSNGLLMAVGSSYPAFIIIAFALAISIIARRLLKRADEVNVLFDASPDAFIYSDPKGRIIRTNKTASSIFGYNQAELKNMTVEDLIEDGLKSKHQQLRKNFIKTRGSRLMLSDNTEIRGVTKAGGLVPLSIAITTTKEGVIAIVRDISQYKRLQTESTHDGLTKLLNHKAIKERLDEEVKRAKRYNRQLSVLLIDLDHFKALNDSEGHAAGDQGLLMAAEHLNAELRKHDHIGRWGGDEFLVVCPELGIEDSLELADRIRRRFASLPFPWSQQLTMSIGISSLVVSSGYSSSQNMFEEADGALYLAKELGRNRHEHYINTKRPRRVK